MPEEADAPPETPVPVQAPVGFWVDVATAVRKELRPPVSGFFSPSDQSPVQGELRGNEVLVFCANGFTLDMVNKPEVLRLVAEKASAILGRPVHARALDRTEKAESEPHMEQLLAFGRAHPDLVKIKET